MIVATLKGITAFVGMAILSYFMISYMLSAVAASTLVNIYPAGDKPYGLSYAEHIKNFWKWLILIPDKENPVNDLTGEKCMNGQSNSSSPVFYLAQSNGGTPDRTCKIPAGKGLFIPVNQVELSDKESPKASVEDLDKATREDQDRVQALLGTLYLKINDKEYKKEDLIKYRTHTDSFEVVFPNNGIFGIAEGGNSTAVADGFYIITEPLMKGNYTVHIKSGQEPCPDPTDPSCSVFAQDIKYTIIAQ